MLMWRTQERAEGFFDEGGHYVERKDEDEDEKDAWFASAKGAPAGWPTRCIPQTGKRMSCPHRAAWLGDSAGQGAQSGWSHWLPRSAASGCLSRVALTPSARAWSLAGQGFQLRQHGWRSDRKWAGRNSSLSLRLTVIKEHCAS